MEVGSASRVVGRRAYESFGRDSVTGKTKPMAGHFSPVSGTCADLAPAGSGAVGAAQVQTASESPGTQARQPFLLFILTPCPATPIPRRGNRWLARIAPESSSHAYRSRAWKCRIHRGRSCGKTDFACARPLEIWGVNPSGNVFGLDQRHSVTLEFDKVADYLVGVLWTILAVTRPAPSSVSDIPDRNR